MGLALVNKLSFEELNQIVSESFSLKEVVRKVGYSADTGRNSDTVKKRIQQLNISMEHFSHQHKIKRTEDNIFCENSTASQATLRRWFIKIPNIEYKCSICGQNHIWQGKELTLTLDHINGKNKDNRLENLRWVCPNCDRQLDTFGFKNYKG